MNAPTWITSAPRRIHQRIIVEGELVLETPACLGNGEDDNSIDMPLLQDPLEGRPLLTGTSIAGALRAYLGEWEGGYGATTAKQPLTKEIFGGHQGDPDGAQSALIVDDALGTAAGVERRQEVTLDPRSRTSAEDRLFDRELWAAGTCFPLRLELLICDNDDETALRRALATALLGFECGEIGLGARKRRGYGSCQVAQWRVRTFDLTTAPGLIAWVETGADPLAAGPDTTTGVSILTALGVTDTLPDQRCYCAITAAFAIEGTLLMGGGEGTADGPDRVHQHARRPGAADRRPVVPGTGAAGALRARAMAIAHLLAPAADADRLARRLVNDLFGPDEIKRGSTAVASPLSIAEAVIEGTAGDWVQFRIRLDRWTAAVLPGALFNAQPATGGHFVLRLWLRNPKAYQVGLLLLLVEDLWDGDLPLGAEIGGGRGRLRGKNARIEWQDPGQPKPGPWTLASSGIDGLLIDGDPDTLNDCVGKQLPNWFEAEMKQLRRQPAEGDQR
jgi:CRISPR/Cas system CSM-associated protein Csm3 (group 7 of RAMP superfamily)